MAASFVYYGSLMFRQAKVNIPIQAMNYHRHSRRRNLLACCEQLEDRRLMAVLLETRNYDVAYIEDTAWVEIARGTKLRSTELDAMHGAELIVKNLNYQPGDQLGMRFPGETSVGLFLDSDDALYRAPGNQPVVRAGSFSGGWNSDTLTIKFDNTVTVAEVEQLLDRIGFTNPSQTPSTATRLIKITLDSPTAGTATDFTTVRVVPMNDRPVLDVMTGGVYRGDEPLRILTAATVTDIDSANFAGGQIEVAITSGGDVHDILTVISASENEISVVGNQIFYRNGLIGTFAGGTAGEPLTISLTAMADPATTQSLFKSIAFTSDTTETTGGFRSLTVRFNDGDGGWSNAQPFTVVVPERSILPAFSGITPIAYTAGSAETAIAPNALLTDVGSQEITGAQLEINYVDGSSPSDQLRLSSGFSDNTYWWGPLGVLLGSTYIAKTIGGDFGEPLYVEFLQPASRELIQKVVQAVTYRSWDSDLSSATRHLRITLKDSWNRGSSSEPIALQLKPSPAAPFIHSQGQDVVFRPQGSPILITPNDEFYDLDATSFQGYVLSATVSENGGATDRLSIASDVVTTSNANVLVDGKAIGTVIGGSGTAPLQVTFNSSATQEAIQKVLQSLRYASTAAVASGVELHKSIIVQVMDRAGLSSDRKPIAMTISHTAALPTPPASITFSTPEEGLAYQEGGRKLSLGELTHPLETEGPLNRDFGGGMLTVSVVEGGTAADRFDASNSWLAVLGKIWGGGNGKPLQILFVPGTTLDDIQGIFSLVQYFREGDVNRQQFITIKMSLSAGDGSAPASVTVNLRLLPIDFPAVISSLPPMAISQSYPQPIAPTIRFADPDGSAFTGVTLYAQVRTNVDEVWSFILPSGRGPGGVDLEPAIGQGFSKVLYEGVYVGDAIGGRVAFLPGTSLEALTAVARRISIRVRRMSGPTMDVIVRFQLYGSTNTNLYRDPFSEMNVTVTSALAVGDATIKTQDSETIDFRERTSPIPLGKDGFAYTAFAGSSTHLGGGRLRVRIVGDSHPQSVLGIRNQGTGPGQIGVQGNEITWEGIVIANFSGGTGNFPLVIEFNDQAESSRVEKLMKALTFFNGSDNPPPSQVIATEFASSQGVIAKENYITVLIRPVNDPSTLNIIGDDEYTEHDTAARIAWGGSVIDPDSPTFSGGKLVVALAGGANAYDQVRIEDDASAPSQARMTLATTPSNATAGTPVYYQGVLIGIAQGGQGTQPLEIFFNRNATREAVEKVLQRIKFTNAGGAIGTTQRRLTFLLDDGDGGTSNVVTRTITVEGVNDAPIIGSLGAPLTWRAGTPAVQVAGAATVEDPDSVHFGGGKLTAYLATGAQASDRLSIQANGDLAVNGSNVLFKGIAIGTFTGGAGSTPLVVTLNAKASPYRVQMLIRSLVYRNTSYEPSTQPREFTVEVSDGSGGTSLKASRTIHVLPLNHAPKLNTALSPTLAAINENNRNAWGTPVWTLLPGYSDVDAGALKGLAITSASGRANGAWQYTLDGGATWLELGAVSLSSAKLLPAQGNLSRVRFVPNANFHGTVQLGYFAWDQTQGVAGGTFDLSGSGKFGGTTAFGWGYETASLTVNPVNTPPRLTLPSAPVGYALNSPAVLLASTATLKDPDTVRFAGGWLKVEITAGADANDRLSIGGPFKVVEGNLIWNNQATMGTVQGGVGSSVLMIQLNANATRYRVEQLVRSIKFGTLGSSKTGLRTVAFSVSDGLSSSNAATRDVQVA